MANHVACEAGIALIVAIYSAVKDESVLPGLVILGDLSVNGSIESVRSLSEPLQTAMENGACRAMIPLENRPDFLNVSRDVMARIRAAFFSDPMMAATKGTGLTETI